MRKIPEALLRLDSTAPSETTLPSGLVRTADLLLEITIWRSPGGFPVCLTASHAHGRQVQEVHLASLAQVFVWIGFQTSPLTHGLRLTGEGPYRVMSQLHALADKLVEWAKANPQKTPDAPNRSPVFFYDEGPANESATTSLGFGTVQKEVLLSAGYAYANDGYRARLTACMGIQRTTLEVTYGNVDAIRRWLDGAGPQLAGALGAGGIGDKLFQSVISGAFIPALGKFDGNRTQPVGIRRVNTLRVSKGLPPLDDEVHIFSDTVINR